MKSMKIHEGFTTEGTENTDAVDGLFEPSWNFMLFMVKNNSSTPMPADPVAGFFAGMKSSLGRMLLGLLAISAGFLFCFLHAGMGDLEDAPAVMIFVGMALPFWWGTYGAWLVVGLIALVGMFACLFAFAHDRNSKLSLFLCLTSAFVYYLPLVLGDKHWIWPVIYYCGSLCLYWVGPFVALKIATRL